MESFFFFLIQQSGFVHSPIWTCDINGSKHFVLLLQINLDGEYTTSVMKRFIQPIKFMGAFMIYL